MLGVEANMTPIQTILCPVDFSDSSRLGVDYAIDLAKRLSASVRLVHVFEPQPLELDDTSPEVSGQVFNALEESAKERLAAERQRCRDAGIDAQIELLVGAPARVIADLSAQVQLIIMSSHGRTGLAHLLMGSVTERVVRLAQCPVLTVPDPKRFAKAKSA
jgi:universal stress protein A